MTPEVTYFLKVNVAIALFYAFYRLFCCKDTFFHWRRIVLLAFLAVSFLYPLLNIQEWIKEQEPMNDLVNLYAAVVMPEVSVQVQESTNYAELLLGTLRYIYICGVILLSIRFLIQLTNICRISFRCKRGTIGGTKVRMLKQSGEPFSFFKWIFINTESLNQKEIDEILTHELTHARQCHSIDVMLSEIGCIICWINPFSWLLKQEIRRNLEYMADNKVIQSGHDSKSYQYHLLGLANQKAIANIYNNFNVLPIKNRISMMNKKRTKGIGRTKYMMFLPLAALLMLISNIEAVARISSEITDEVLQERYITYKGQVLDEHNKPLPDVSVGIKGTHNGTLTDANGKFKIDAKPTQSLWFSYVGMSGVVYSLKDAKENKEIIIRLKTETGEYKVTQDNKPIEEDGVIFQVVEQMPEFPGGMQECLKFLGKNIRYPEAARKDKIEGRVIVQFIIDKDGKVIEPSIARSISPELDNEALRVIKLMPKWKPGTQRGKAVKVQFTMPVTFNLSNGNNSSTISVAPPLEKPLIIVDNIEMEENFDIHALNADYIESISVLKDKSATEKYGDKGKKGVIIVKMKKKATN